MSRRVIKVQRKRDSDYANLRAKRPKSYIHRQAPKIKRVLTGIDPDTIFLNVFLVFRCKQLYDRYYIYYLSFFYSRFRKQPLPMRKTPGRDGVILLASELTACWITMT